MPTINIDDDLAKDIMAKWKKEHPYDKKIKLTRIIHEVGIDYLNHENKNEE